MGLDDLERRLQARLNALGSVTRAELLNVLMLPDSSEPTGSESSGLPREPHPHRTPDRLRGGPVTSKRCSSACCGRQIDRDRAHREDFYNYNRPHGGLGGQTPYERLRQKTTSPV
jgi:hypothetical protein